MMSLNIHKTTSKFQPMTFVETIDTALLSKLINSDLLHTVSWTSFSGVVFENEKQQLLQLKKLIKNNQLKVTYKTPGYGYGRVNPKRSLSLCCLRKEVRHTLARDFYVDIDVDNCHPAMMLQLCEKNDIAVKYLKRYVSKREQYLAEVMETYNVNREAAKKLFIRLAYHGTFKAWAEEFVEASKVKETTFIKNYAMELKTIGIHFREANPDIAKVVKGLNKVNDTGSLVSIVMQEYERRVLEACFDYLVRRKLVTNNAVLCYDGLMIPKTAYKESLLKELATEVREKMGFSLGFSTKAMDNDYTKELEKFVDVKSFEYQVKEFEKTHCKIVNKAVYAKLYKGEYIFFNEAKLRAAYKDMRVNDDYSNKTKSFIDQYTTYEDIRKYDDIGTYPPPLHCPKNILNTWIPFEASTYTGPYKKNDEALQFILKHIQIMCGNDTPVGDYITKWIAQMIQYQQSRP